MTTTTVIDTYAKPPSRSLAYRLRVELSELRHSFSTRRRAETLTGLLLDLLRLPDSRAEASSVLELALRPAVAHKFGFGADHHISLARILEHRRGIESGA